jgi:hypothetical protein
LGSLGEALFFGLLFFLGDCAVGALLAADFRFDVRHDAARLRLWLLAFGACFQFVLDPGRWRLRVRRVAIGTSRERRLPLAIKAVNLDLISEAIVQRARRSVPAKRP